MFEYFERILSIYIYGFQKVGIEKYQLSSVFLFLTVCSVRSRVAGSQIVIGVVWYWKGKWTTIQKLKTETDTSLCIKVCQTLLWEDSRFHTMIKFPIVSNNCIYIGCKFPIVSMTPQNDAGTNDWTDMSEGPSCGTLTKEGWPVEFQSNRQHHLP